MWRRLLLLTGLAALVTFFLRRHRPPEPADRPLDADPADELRRKLDEAREREDGSAVEAPDAVAELDQRRRDVHARARAAADEMRDTGSD
jgi:hypothetical protein